VSTSLFDLSGRVALVTGGSKGLGKSMARGFLQAGADVMISSRHKEELHQTAEELGAGVSSRIEWIVADMVERPQVDSLASTALARMGRIDILVNNAGGNTPQSIEDVVDQDWDTILELNLSSCMRLTRALVPQMKERGWGRIIHISSVLGLGGKEGRSAYCSTKSALLGLTRAAALDLGRFNITVNCIAPGPFLTDLPGRVLTAEQKQTFAQTTALGRWGNPDELIGPALLLASEAGSYITGTAILVDGGALSRVF
jgi:NAD(P)-dependent dehydrogenase (short-subunit alcohol dehydrogenase family)